MIETTLKSIIAFFLMIVLICSIWAYSSYKSYSEKTGGTVHLSTKQSDNTSVKINAQNKKTGKKGNWWFDVDRIEGEWAFTYGTTINGKTTERMWKDGLWRDVKK